MHAIVLVGGQGTRLRPLTARRHKSLVPLLNRPAIEHLFEWLRRSGIHDVVLAIGRMNEDLAEAYPAGEHNGLRIRHVMERERLESGGAIRYAVEQAGISDRFVVLNGDVYLDFDFGEALRQHEARQAVLTLALTPVEDPSSFGVAVVDEQSLVTGFVEKPPPGTAPSNLVNAGAWIFERRIVDDIPPGAVRVEETLFPSLVGRRQPVFGFVSNSLWADLGTPARYLTLSKELVAHQGQCIDPGCSVDPAATIEGSTVGPGTKVAAGALVRHSVVWERVAIGEGAHVEGSIIGDSTTIGPGASVLDAVIGPGASVGANQQVPAGTIIEADAKV